MSKDNASTPVPYAMSDDVQMADDNLRVIGKPGEIGDTTVDGKSKEADSFGPAVGGGRTSPSGTASEHDLGGVGAAEVVQLTIGPEILRIGQAMQHEELAGIICRMKDGSARQEQAALGELVRRRGPNS